MQNTPKEWSLIKNIQYRVQRPNDHTIVPLGDDAFVFRNYPGYSVICQDMMMEGTHFSLEYFSALNLGYKSLAVNLSDIAAMGARPHFAQVSLALPRTISPSWIDDFYFGMSQLADQFDCQIAGGDLCHSEDKIVIDVSVHGSTENPITRKGTQVGDLLLSSGPLGLSHTGLIAFQNKLEAYDEAKRKHLRPLPRLDLIKDLQMKHSKIHGLMDCSDGLINDALQLCPEGSGFHIFQDTLPLHPETNQIAISLGLQSHDFALWGGEDYELLLTISPDDLDLFPQWNLVGQFTKESGVFLSSAQQKKEITKFEGWQHF